MSDYQREQDRLFQTLKDSENHAEDVELRKALLGYGGTEAAVDRLILNVRKISEGKRPIPGEARELANQSLRKLAEEFLADHVGRVQ